MRALRKSVAVLLAAALLLAQVPAQNLAHALGQAAAPAAAAATPAFSPALVPISATAQTWRLYPSCRFFDDFPGLKELQVLPSETTFLPALQRSLDRSPLSPESIARLAPKEQLETVRAAVRGLTLSALDSAGQDSLGASPAARIEASSKKINALQDLWRIMHVLGKEGERLSIPLNASISAERKRLYEESSALIAAKAGMLTDDAGSARWRGRTADLVLEDGAVLSFKRHENQGELDEERKKMESALSFGIEAPIPLLADFHYSGSKTIPTHTPNVFTLSADFLPYVIPKELAQDYRAYLNDKLPAAMSPEEKAAKIESSALKAVDHMLLLLHNDRAHASLTALSHNGSKWEWDFWRWNPPFSGRLRWGPSFINHWKKGFFFPNIRHCGLADWEHIEYLDFFYQFHQHDDHGNGTVRHDSYSLALGQNLAELSFILIHSAAVNGLSHERTARIILSALKRYLGNLLPEQELKTLDEGEMLQALRSTSRRFRPVRAFWKPAIIALGLLGLASIPFLVWPFVLIFASPAAAPGFFLLDALVSFWLYMLLFALADKIGMVNHPTYNNIPGTVFHPLIMQVIKPAVELLRKNQDRVGLRALSHPSGSPWDLRQAILFGFALPAAFILPAGLLGYYGFIGALLAGHLGILLPPQAVLYTLAAGLSLAPLRGFYDLIMLGLQKIRALRLAKAAPSTGPPQETIVLETPPSRRPII
ncbi:MAG: hypothetical protein WCU88_06440 [Elusimicrobiota bacterium]|jgi:hypothetical protein